MFSAQQTAAKIEENNSYIEMFQNDEDQAALEADNSKLRSEAQAHGVFII